MAGRQQVISTPAAPRPRGHYSQAIRVGDTVWTAGQIPVIPSGNADGDETRFAPDMEGQAEQVIRNVAAVLDAAGATLADIVSVTVHVADSSQWGPFNKVYARMMGDSRPARTVVRGGELPIPGILVEMSVVAVVGSGLPAD